MQPARRSHQLSGMPWTNTPPGVCLLARQRWPTTCWITSNYVCHSLALPSELGDSVTMGSATPVFIPLGCDTDQQPYGKPMPIANTGCLAGRLASWQLFGARQGQLKGGCRCTDAAVVARAFPAPTPPPPQHTHHLHAAQCM